MLKEINGDDVGLIKELEITFPDIFTDHPIKIDLENNPFSKYLVYIDHNEVLGFINYTRIYDRIEIININVQDKSKRRGVGSKLLEKVLDNEVLNFTLEVNINNISAINLYKKYGFKQIAIKKSYYDGTDGILMERVG
jgi:[ribosomal protein S18]-alanine N-acetyltransferase